MQFKTAIHRTLYKLGAVQLPGDMQFRFPSLFHLDHIKASIFNFHVVQLYNKFSFVADEFKRAYEHHRMQVCVCTAHYCFRVLQLFCVHSLVAVWLFFRTYARCAFDWVLCQYLSKLNVGNLANNYYFILNRVSECKNCFLCLCCLKLLLIPVHFYQLFRLNSSLIIEASNKQLISTHTTHCPARLTTYF